MSRRNSERRRRRSSLVQRMTDFSLSGGAHDHRNSRGEPLPVRRLLIERLAPGASQRIILRAAVVIAFAPFGFNPTLLLQLMQGRIKRTLAYLEHLLRHLLDA